MMDVILDGPRVQVPVECLDRNIGYSQPLPPPPVDHLEYGIELEDGTEVSLTDDLPRDLVSCEQRRPAPRAEQDAPRWACPDHWLEPSMRAEGPTVWLDPEPIRLAGPATMWLSPRSESGSTRIC